MSADRYPDREETQKWLDDLWFTDRELYDSLLHDWVRNSEMEDFIDYCNSDERQQNQKGFEENGHDI